MVIEALRMGEAALVAPFRYTILIWATALGFLIWGELPDIYVLAGALIIVASGWYMLRSAAARPM
jgi:drug/metabolite transporter (DMT)-like permease